MKTQLYRYFDAQDKLLYVGVSLSAVVRLRGRKSVEWIEQVAKITIETFETRGLALAAERLAIQSESPAFNIHHQVKGCLPVEMWGIHPATLNSNQVPRENGVLRLDKIVVRNPHP